MQQNCSSEVVADRLGNVRMKNLQIDFCYKNDPPCGLFIDVVCRLIFVTKMILLVVYSFDVKSGMKLHVWSVS